MKTTLIGWIWLVTAIDIWCCQWLTVATELNPVARLIMEQAGVWGLLSCKIFGTYLATEWLRYLPLHYTVIVSLLMLTLLLVLGGLITL